MPSTRFVTFAPSIFREAEPIIMISLKAIGLTITLQLRCPNIPLIEPAGSRSA
jgi:hypothetical protein